MANDHRSPQLRVAPLTLEPDPVFLAMLANLSASSRPASIRTARSAGLRMIVATASVAVIATATWASGVSMGSTPLSPADSPAQLEPSDRPSPGDVATPQSDVSTSPGSPVSPGLPGLGNAHRATHQNPADDRRGKKGDGMPDGVADGTPGHEVDHPLGQPPGQDATRDNGAKSGEPSSSGRGNKYGHRADKPRRNAAPSDRGNKYGQASRN